MIDQSDHFLRVIGQLGLLILVALIGGNMAGLFSALHMPSGYHAHLFLGGLGCAMGAALVTWVMSLAALIGDLRAYRPMWWTMVVLSVLSAAIFAVAVLSLAAKAGGAA